MNVTTKLCKTVFNKKTTVERWQHNQIKRVLLLIVPLLNKGTDHHHHLQQCDPSTDLQQQFNNSTDHLTAVCLYFQRRWHTSGLNSNDRYSFFQVAESVFDAWQRDKYWNHLTWISEEERRERDVAFSLVCYCALMRPKHSFARIKFFLLLSARVSLSSPFILSHLSLSLSTACKY